MESLGLLSVGQMLVSAFVASCIMSSDEDDLAPVSFLLHAPSPAHNLSDDSSVAAIDQ